MNDPLSLVLSVAIVVVGLLTVYYSVASAPSLDGERWFKVMLVTLLRGAVEARGGDADEWEREVLRFVPYHPAGRLPERKAAHPEHYSPPGLSVPGEVALTEALAGLASIEDRWSRMYDADEAAQAARMDDPSDLGPGYDPASLLGPGGGWEDLADWGAGATQVFSEALDRRLEARWLLVRGATPDAEPPDVLQALASVLGERARWIDVPAGEIAAAADALGEALTDAVPAVGERAIVVATGTAAHLVLRAMVPAPGLRDRVLAVLSVGGVIGGLPDEDGPFGTAVVEDWMGRWFDHRELDTEVRRITPFLSVQWLDRSSPVPGITGLPISASRFPEPRHDGRTPICVEVVDLGVLPADPALPVQEVARALRAVVTCWILSRG